MSRHFPIKIAPSNVGGFGPQWFLGPTPVHNANGISIGSAAFAGLTIVTDRQTDRQTDRRYSVCNNTAMRANNNTPTYNTTVP